MTIKLLFHPVIPFTLLVIASVFLVVGKAWIRQSNFVWPRPQLPQQMITLVSPQESSSMPEVTIIHRNLRSSNAPTMMNHLYGDPKSVAIKSPVSVALPPLSTEVTPRLSSGPSPGSKLYYCGGPQPVPTATSNTSPEYSRNAIPFALAVLPELGVDKGKQNNDNMIPLTKETLRTATEDDVLVHHVHRWCDVDDLNLFPGRQMHFNAEHYDIHPAKLLLLQQQQQQQQQRLTSSLSSLCGDAMISYLDCIPPNPKIVTLGPHKDDAVLGSIRIPFVTQSLKLLRSQRHRDMIFEQSERPKNTRMRFALYVNSHYVEYREKTAYDIARRVYEMTVLGHDNAINPNNNDEGRALYVAGKCEGNIKVYEGKEQPPLWPTQSLKPPQCTPFQIHNASDSRPPFIRPAPEKSSLFYSVNKGQNEEIYKNYRFGIVMENTYSGGYISEKILNAFFSGTIPIYFGTDEVFDIFNPSAFVFYDVRDPVLAEAALNKIVELEKNQTMYEEMLNQPILANGEETIKKYFSWKDEIGEGELKARIRKMMGYQPGA